MKHLLFSNNKSKHTPTKPSPIKEKTKEASTLFQIERIPPLFPTDGRKHQQQSL
jgi:hypothetical protein